MADCYYHPERPGVGVCMRCRRVICADCCTRLEGVNHCFACLDVLGRGREARGSGVAEVLVRTGAMVFGSLILFVLFWFLQGMLAP